MKQRMQTSLVLLSLLLLTACTGQPVETQPKPAPEPPAPTVQTLRQSNSRRNTHIRHLSQVLGARRT